MRCWGGSWNVPVQWAASMNWGKWSKYGRLGRTMCWMWKSGVLRWQLMKTSTPSLVAVFFFPFANIYVSAVINLCIKRPERMYFRQNRKWRLDGANNVFYIKRFMRKWETQRLGSIWWKPNWRCAKLSWKSTPVESLHSQNKSSSCRTSHKASEEKKSIQALWMRLKFVSFQMIVRKKGVKSYVLIHFRIWK